MQQFWNNGRWEIGSLVLLIPAGSKWRSKLPYCSLVSLVIWDSPHVSERYEYYPLFGRNQRSRRHWTQWRKERLFIPKVLAKSRVQVGRAKTWSDNGGFGYALGIVPNFLERLQHACNWISKCLLDCSWGFRVNLQGWQMADFDQQACRPL